MTELFRRHRAKRAKSKKGFTLVELIIVIAILAVLGTVVGVVIGGQLANAKKEAVRTSTIEYYTNVQQAAMWTELGTQVCFKEDADGNVTKTDQLCEYLNSVFDKNTLTEGDIYIYMKSTTVLDGVIFTNSNGVGGRGMAGTTDLSAITDASAIPAGATVILEVKNKTIQVKGASTSTT